MRHPVLHSLFDSRTDLAEAIENIRAFSDDLTSEKTLQVPFDRYEIDSMIAELQHIPKPIQFNFKGFKTTARKPTHGESEDFSHFHLDFVIDIKPAFLIKAVLLGGGYSPCFMTPDHVFLNMYSPFADGEKYTPLQFITVPKHELIHACYSKLSVRAKQRLLDDYQKYEPEYQTAFMYYLSGNVCSYSKIAEGLSPGIDRADYLLISTISQERALAMRPGEVVDEIRGDNLYRFLKIPIPRHVIEDEDFPKDDYFIVLSSTADEYFATRVMDDRFINRMHPKLVGRLKKEGFLDPRITRLAQAIALTISKISAYSPYFVK